MYLLDTVAVSETSKRISSPGIQKFLSEQPDDQLYISVVSLGELTYGWHRLPEGARKSDLRRWLDLVEAEFGVRALDVDVEVARMWGRLRTGVKKNGFDIALPDLLIAATAIRHDLTVVTRNVKDFAPTGCKLLNPWNLDS